MPRGRTPDPGGAVITEPRVFTRAVTRWFGGRNRTQKARLNAMAAALDTGARMLVGFVVNPLLVAGLGSHAFGLWQVLRQMVGYAQPAGGRPTQALKWTIAKQQSSSDTGAKRQVVGATLVVWLCFLPLLLGAGSVVVWFAPVWMDTPAELASTARMAAGLLLLNLLLLTLVEIPRATLAGENLAYKRMGLSALLILAGGALTALALHFELGLVGVAACPALASIATGLLFLGVVRRHVPWFGAAMPSRPSLVAFFQLSGWFVVWRVVVQVMNASDLVVLGAFDSVETVATYTLTRYVPEIMIAVVVMGVSGALPGMGAVLGSGDLSRARSLRSEAMGFVWLVATVVSTTTVAWNPSFVGLWVGAEHFAGAFPTLLIVLMTMQFVLIRLDANIIDLTLDVGRKVVVGTLGAATALLLAVLAVAHFESGIVGLCLGFMAGRAILSVSYPWMVGRVLGISPGRQLAGAAKPAAVTGLLLFAGYELGAVVALESWPELVAGASLTAALAAGIALFAGLSPDQRQRLWSRLRA